MPEFTSCPIASRFIETCTDARAYYATRLVRDHHIAVKDHAIVVRFNAEETHLFSDDRMPCPPEDVLVREGKSGEVRCFCLQRARRLDDVLDTLRRAARVHRAKMPGGVIVYGPASAKAPRLAVVLGPPRSFQTTWFVRTAYDVSAQAFAQACRSEQPAPWPPKSR